MEPAHWWQDLCELLVSEVYALIYEHETLEFRHVPAGQADLIEGILLGLAGEWQSAYQEYQAAEALQLIAWLHIAGRRYSHYAGAARRLGSGHWMPIVALPNRPRLLAARNSPSRCSAPPISPECTETTSGSAASSSPASAPMTPRRRCGSSGNGDVSRMPTRRRPPPTPALGALSGTEHAPILVELLTSHPELRSEAEDAAR